MISSNPSPFRYPGGKSRFIPKFESFITDTFPPAHFSTFYEIYAGGAAIGLYMLFNDRCENLILNELDVAIYSVWMAIKHEPGRLIDFVANTKTDFDTYMQFRNNFKNYSKNEYDFELGAQTLVLNRLSFSGILKTPCPVGGFSQTGKYKIDCRFHRDKLLRSIAEIAKYKDRIYVSKIDAIDMLSLKYSDSDFIFIDPPYLERGSALYRFYYTKDDFRRLSSALRGINANWAMTMKDHYMLNAFDSREVDVMYTIVSNKVAKEKIYFGKAVA